MATGLPVSWDATEHVVWRQPVDGNGWSSPIVYDDRVYVTTAVPEEDSAAHSLRVVCLASETGEMLWNVEVFRQEEGTIHKKNSHASATPITDGERLYVHFGPYGTAALDFDGRVLWRTQQVQFNPVHGTGGSPIVVDDLLIFNCDGGDQAFVAALDKRTGDERWRTARPAAEEKTFSFSTPLYIEGGGRGQVVSAGSHVVCSYDPATGEEIWRVRYPDKWSIVPRPVYAGGMVLVCTGYEGPAALLAIRPDGQGDVTDTHVVWSSTRYVPHNPSPLVVGELLFLVADNGVASCRELASGEIHWQKRLGGTYSASPLYAEGRIYVQSEDGECVVFAAADEFRELARNDLGERSLASFAVADQALIIRTSEAVYRIE